MYVDAQPNGFHSALFVFLSLLILIVVVLLRKVTCFLFFHIKSGEEAIKRKRFTESERIRGKTLLRTVDKNWIQEPAIDRRDRTSKTSKSFLHTTLPSVVICESFYLYIKLVSAESFSKHILYIWFKWILFWKK